MGSDYIKRKGGLWVRSTKQTVVLSEREHWLTFKWLLRYVTITISFCEKAEEFMSHLFTLLIMPYYINTEYTAQFLFKVLNFDVEKPCCSVKWNNEFLSQKQRWQRVREVEYKASLWQMNRQLFVFISWLLSSHVAARIELLYQQAKCHVNFFVCGVVDQ